MPKISVSCDFCHQSFLKKSDLLRHIKRHTNEKDFTCEKCGSKFRLKQTLMRHMQTHMKTFHICGICQSEYKTQKALENHSNKLHSGRIVLHSNDFVNTQSSEQEIELESDVSNDTPNALRVDLSQNDLNQVMTMVVDVVKIRVEKDKLLKNQLDENSEKSSLSCSSCGKTFSKPADLRRHVDTVHEKIRRFVCSIDGCGKSFGLKCTLQRHLMTHNSCVEKRKLVECGTCHKKLSTTGSLKHHQRIHDNIKPYSCHVCQLSYRTPGNLKSHMSRIHSK
jgi:KRAB domain-containing zinc finger protein